MKLDYIEVSRGEAKTVTDKDPVSALAIVDLGADFAMALFNPAYRKIALAREPSAEGLKDFVESVIGLAEIEPQPIVQVRLFCGEDAAPAKDKIKGVLTQLHAIDAGRDILNIVSSNIGKGTFPPSFRTTAFDGKVGEIETTG